MYGGYYARIMLNLFTQYKDVMLSRAEACRWIERLLAHLDVFPFVELIGKVVDMLADPAAVCMS